ncbi:MAG: hypothetical protein L3J70_04060 [Gammaproteobacteria bacterium]|nr:hypothetical protein [Gammaproteobacteria bacterium]
MQRFLLIIPFIGLDVLGSHLLFASDEYTKPEAELEGVLMQQQSGSDGLLEEVTASEKEAVEVLVFDFVELGRWSLTDDGGDESWEGSSQGLDARVKLPDDNSPVFVVDRNVDQMRDSLRNSLSAKGRPGDQARSIIGQFRDQNGEDPAELYNNALQFTKSGEAMDAYLLYYFAAREGHINASIALAKMYDPIRFLKERSHIEKADAALAFNWYKKAAGRGSRVAADHLESLRHWVETSLPDSTLEKQRLLLLWKKL